MKTIIIFAIVITIATVGFKVGMAYADKSTLKSTISAMDRVAKLSTGTKEEIAKTVLERLSRNGVDYITEQDLSITVDQNAEVVTISSSYIVSIDLFGVYQHPLQMETAAIRLRD